jgi:hypothetical protein
MPMAWPLPAKEAMSMLPATQDRVPQQTSDAVNERIRQATHDRVLRVARGGVERIDARLAELDREWDVERTLEANAATASLVGLALGALVRPGFFVFSAVVAGFLLQHALQGWCPPLPVFRRLGVRTAREIDDERHVLKLLRGDFASMQAADGQVTSEQVVAALDAAAR